MLPRNILNEEILKHPIIRQQKLNASQLKINSLSLLFTLCSHGMRQINKRR